MQNVIFLLFRRMRMPLIVLICVYALSVLGLVLIPGMDDQGRPWRMDFFHAFYFVSFMGSTIGFGEIPYPFTDAQRLWTTFAIYTTVVAWLYAIGALLAVIQDQAFRQVVARNAFMRAVRRIAEPFYLVCGYGDTGSLLVRTLGERGIRAVVNDINQNRINALEIEDVSLPVPGVCADAAYPATLLDAGLCHPQCIGVIALTNADEVNLKIAITSKLINPRLPVICRAESHDAEANMASFGTDHIINPFDAFADRLAMAIQAPGVHLISEWMTSIQQSELTEPLVLPKGLWILCGFGRFGKAVQRYFTYVGIQVVVIEPDPERTGMPPDSVVGRGTEAITLREARIDQAVGIVAGTDDDSNNLSIIMTARELRPDIFTVVRQNHRSNDTVFEAAPADLVMQPGSIIARKVMALITAPLLVDFLRLARHQSDEWANLLVSRAVAVAGDGPPFVWSITIADEDAPAVTRFLAEGRVVTLEVLYRHPRDYTRRLPCFAAYVKRDSEDFLLPADDFQLHRGDRVLLCGRRPCSHQISWATHNYNVLRYLSTGIEQPSSWIWRRLSRAQ